jgi:hypothetical protein
MESADKGATDAPRYDHPDEKDSRLFAASFSLFRPIGHLLDGNEDRWNRKSGQFNPHY